MNPFENALRNPQRNPIEEANGYRDSLPEDGADELSLARGEIAWLREAVRRFEAAIKADDPDMDFGGYPDRFDACAGERRMPGYRAATVANSRPLRIVGHSTAGPLYEAPKDGVAVFIASDGSLHVARRSMICPNNL